MVNGPQLQARQQRTLRFWWDGSLWRRQDREDREDREDRGAGQALGSLQALGAHQA